MSVSRPQVHHRQASLIIGIAYIVFFCLYAVLRFSIIQPSSSDIWSDPDDYLRMALLPISELRFWAGPRVVGYPFLLKLFSNNEQNILTFQFIVATLCWTFFAIAIARSLKQRWLGPIAFALILAFSLSRDIIQWDFLLFTESLAGSLLVLIFGLWCLILCSYERQSSKQRILSVSILAPVALYWSFLRDTNAYVLLGFAGVIGIVVLSYWRKLPDRRLYLGLAMLFTAVFLLQNWTADHAKRWQYPLMNVIGKRILVNEERTAFFAANHMPTDRNVMRFRDQYAHAHGNAVFRNNNMAYFRAWLDEHGKSTYYRFLLSRPTEALREPIQEYLRILRPPIGYYGEQGGLVFPGWMLTLTSIFYIRTPEYSAIPIAILLLWLAFNSLRQGRVVWLVPVVMALMIYPLMFLNWHGDAIEVGRHSYLVGVLLRLTLWVLVCFVLDSAFAWVSERQQQQVAQPKPA